MSDENTHEGIDKNTSH